MAAPLSPLGSRPVTATAGRDEEGPLWNTIRERLYKPEVTHIKRLVGKDLIQQNRALWDEVSCLRQIMAEFQQQNDVLCHSRQQQAQLFATPHRDLLRRQVQILCEDVRSQAALCGQAPEDLLPELKDKGLRDFIVGPGGSERANHVSLRPSPPATPSTRPPSSCGGVSGCTTPDAGGMPRLPLGRPLRISELDGVAEGIREAIEEQNATLLSLIGEQMQQFEAEDTRRAQASRAGGSSEPSTSDLQQLARKLQDIVASPSLRSLAVTSAMTLGDGGCAENVAAGNGDFLLQRPITGGSHVRRLKALIAQRRQSVGADGPLVTLGAPPQAKLVESASEAGSLAILSTNANVVAKPGFDPFFDDPFA